MCRKNHTYALCLLSLASGMLLGHSIHSWFWCFVWSAAAIALGWLLMNKR